ncbi:MAG: hypothetical protein D3923_11605 [Candidatus Electrothrix sp. AR3]|nr:hypothetical protein [Candidatus Electrothrix sp. AR3]
MKKDDIVRLEQLVDTLINKYKEQKERFQVLEQKLRDREEECELLQLDNAELHKQRTEVGSKVAGLLGRIEQWDAEIEKKEVKDELSAE